LKRNLCSLFCLVALAVCVLALPALADQTTWDAWNWNAQNATGLVDFTLDGVNWNQAPGSTLYAFDVLGPNGTFYSDLGSPVNYQCCFGGTIGGVTSPVGLVYQGNQFTSPFNGTVNTIDVGLSWVVGTNSANVSLWTSVNNVPGVELYNQWVFNQPTFGSSTTALATINLNVALTGGAQYFVVVSEPSAVPEPGTLVMLGSGVLAVAGAFRRKLWL
jgi:hypothetical protein